MTLTADPQTSGDDATAAPTLDYSLRMLEAEGIPVGIVTAAIGGPFLIYLMIVMSRKASV